MAKEKHKADNLRLRHSWSEDALVDHLWDDDGHVQISVLEILSEVAPTDYESDFICDVLELIHDLTKAGASRYQIAREVLRQLQTDAPDEPWLFECNNVPVMSTTAEPDPSTDNGYPEYLSASFLEIPNMTLECGILASRLQLAFSHLVGQANISRDDEQLLLFDLGEAATEGQSEKLFWDVLTQRTTEQPIWVGYRAYSSGRINWPLQHSPPSNPNNGTGGAGLVSHVASGFFRTVRPGAMANSFSRCWSAVEQPAEAPDMLMIGPGAYVTVAMSKWSSFLSILQGSQIGLNTSYENDNLHDERTIAHQPPASYPTDRII